MSQASRPSYITLPPSSRHATVLDFLAEKFPHISSEVWKERMDNGKVFWRESEGIITTTTPFQQNKTLGYYREVRQEPQIPFDEIIIEHNDHFLIAHKPPFLPVMPGGAFVNECLQERLIRRTGINELQAIHRLDRDTAGLVMFSTNPETRSDYHQLFSQQTIHKEYQTIANVPASVSITGKKWHIKNYLTRGKPKFRFSNSNDPSQGQYAESLIECIEQNHQQAVFKLSPVTGRTHQLRLHMMEIGYPILNDRFYPELQAKQQDNYQQPLQLLAKTLRFIDPISQNKLTFTSPRSLKVAK